MYNDFVLIGPAGDPARVAEAKTAAEALRRIADTGATFVSRGDRSGTHAAELRQWQVAGVDPKSNKGYRDAGAGMGPTLNMAAALNGYTLADRGTWLVVSQPPGTAPAAGGRSAALQSVRRDPREPGAPSARQAAEGRRFIAWLAGKEGQEAIASYRIEGQPLFFPQSTAPQ